MTFHPDGHCLFSGSHDSLRVHSWEPTKVHDAIGMGWGKIRDIAIASTQLVRSSPSLFFWSGKNNTALIPISGRGSHTDVKRLAVHRRLEASAAFQPSSRCKCGDNVGRVEHRHCRQHRWVWNRIPHRPTRAEVVYQRKARPEWNQAEVRETILLTCYCGMLMNPDVVI